MTDSEKLRKDVRSTADLIEKISKQMVSIEKFLDKVEGNIWDLSKLEMKGSDEQALLTLASSITQIRSMWAGLLGRNLAEVGYACNTYGYAHKSDYDVYTIDRAVHKAEGYTELAKYPPR